MSKQACQVYHFAFRWSFRKDKEDLDEFKVAGQETLFNVLKEKADKFIFQLELTGDDNWHFQGYMHLQDKDRPKAWAVKHNELLPGIEVQAASKAGIESLKKYCMKQDTRQEGPWADKAVYMGQDLPSVLRPWQEEVKKLCLQDPDDRTIYWIYDKEGSSGKSKFAKYMQFHHDVVKLTYADAKDLLNLVTKFQGRRCYIFDLSRTKPATFSSMDMYSAMEDIKNGHFINTKYETESVLMACPNIIVFANILPDTDKLSNDRWNIMYMKDQNLLKHNPWLSNPVHDAAQALTQITTNSAPVW